MFKFDRQKPVEKLTLARASLSEFLPLIYPVSMRFAWVENNSVPTCGVDKDGTFYYNKNFIDTIGTLDEAVNVVAHEAMHIVQKHHYRTPIIPGVDQQTTNFIFNLAADRVLTALLWNENKIFKGNRIVTEVLNIDQKVVDEVTNKYKYTEALFQAMFNAYQKSCNQQKQGQGQPQQGQGQGQGQPQQGQGQPQQGQGQPQQGQGQGQGQGQSAPDDKHDIVKKIKDGLAPGAIKDSLQSGPCQAHKHHGMAEEEGELGEDGYDPWRMAVQLGKDLQKSRGDSSSVGMKEFCAKLFAPKISWKSILLQYLDKVFGFNDYNYYKRARRSITDEIVFPGNDPPYGRVAVAIDMSGSMSEPERIAALSETYSICGSYVSGVVCIMHTTDVYFVGEIKDPEDVKKMPWSNGGTSHLEVFDVLGNEHKKWKVNEEENAIQLLICFTDMETEFPKHAPNIPVIWVNTASNNATAPFGEVINYKM